MNRGNYEYSPPKGFETNLSSQYGENLQFMDYSLIQIFPEITSIISP